MSRCEPALNVTSAVPPSQNLKPPRTARRAGPDPLHCSSSTGPSSSIATTVPAPHRPSRSADERATGRRPVTATSRQRHPGLQLVEPGPHLLAHGVLVGQRHLVLDAL